MFNYSLDASELQRLQYEMKREHSDDDTEEYFDSEFSSMSSTTHFVVLAGKMIQPKPTIPTLQYQIS